MGYTFLFVEVASKCSIPRFNLTVCNESTHMARFPSIPVMQSQFIANPDTSRNVRDSFVPEVLFRAPANYEMAIR